MKYFCTYFDFNYLSRAVVLHRSLERTCPAFRLFCLCMDDHSFKAVAALEVANLTAIGLGRLEEQDRDLLHAKGNRSQVEYYYTCGPSLCLFLLKRYPEIDLLSYIDADLMFFSDPEPLFEELVGFSVGIIEHRFSRGNEKLRRFGSFNVGWMSFRRDRNGLECLQWWRERCIEWCFDRVEGARFADQKYLEEFPVRFKSVRVIQHKGANVAPWNLANYHITTIGDRIWVDDQPLIFFHFHGFKALTKRLFDTNLGWYKTTPSRLVKTRIFGSYIRELQAVIPAVGPLQSIRYQSRKQRAFARVARTVLRTVRASLRRAYIAAPRSSHCGLDEK